MRFFFTLLIGLWGLAAYAGPDLRPSQADFREICRQHRGQAAEFTIIPPTVGERGYFPVLALEATQTRFSFLRFLNAMSKVLKEDPAWFSHDRRQSLYGIEKAMKLAYYRGKLFIVDGHHRALISTYLGAQTVPGEILADFSILEPDDFRREMEVRGWAYWRNHRNQPLRPVDICEMNNDPNFLLARMIIRRVSTELSEDLVPRVVTSTGSALPLAVKIDGDIPFFEIHLADALRRGGVEYDDQREGGLSKAELKKYLAILQRSAGRKSAPVAKVLLLDKVRPVAKRKLEQLVQQHLQRADCERELK